MGDETTISVRGYVPAIERMSQMGESITAATKAAGIADWTPPAVRFQAAETVKEFVDRISVPVSSVAADALREAYQPVIGSAVKAIARAAMPDWSTIAGVADAFKARPSWADAAIQIPELAEPQTIVPAFDYLTDIELPAPPARQETLEDLVELQAQQVEAQAHQIEALVGLLDHQRAQDKARGRSEGRQWRMAIAGFVVGAVAAVAAVVTVWQGMG